MDKEYSVQVLEKLEEIFHRQQLLRPLRIQRYDPGKRVEYTIKGVAPALSGKVTLEIEKFAGGGYAGQVYRARLIEAQISGGKIAGLLTGNSYALKILIPPKGISRWFRNFIFGLGFQGPFSPQTNPDASRAGALWQKFIRRGAGIRLGSETAVVDILAILVDPTLGSYGELSEWVEGRTWRFEMDDLLDARRKWKPGKTEEGLGSPEYRAKRAFMSGLVGLMHEMGAVELARQYEWWTCKSQPNALKRLSSDPDPSGGLVAVDFRAGLALLPFLPMCPADFKLILKGILRGSLVQFDRGNLDLLQNFVDRHEEHFTDLKDSLQELKQAEKSYRESLPDVSHHHLRLAYSRTLWSVVITSLVEGWKIRNITDEKTSEKLSRRRGFALLFALLGLIPFLGKLFRRVWGRQDFRQHYRRIFSSFKYFRRAGRGRIAEALIHWHRSGRVDDRRAMSLAEHPLRFFVHLPLVLLPPRMHRFFSDRHFARQALHNIFIRPFKLYFKAEVREKWLLQMVSDGQKKGMVTQNEAARINTQIKEPFIQKYLKSLAVHVCTLPVTQIISVAVAIIYVRLHPELTWQEASVRAGLILGLFQVTPISPGSIVRGLYVTFLVLKERNFKDYNIAFYLSFFKYIGYLAFPIQMAYRYPDLARFMAGHWATGAAHIVPVFGEQGALLEHGVFDIFYNYPLTLRRRFRLKASQRAGQKKRSWHLGLCVLAATGSLALLDGIYSRISGHLPSLGDVWWLSLWFPLIAAIVSAGWSGGTSVAKRLSLGAICASLTGLFHAAVFTVLSYFQAANAAAGIKPVQYFGQFAIRAGWQVLLFTLVAVIGVFLFETRPMRASRSKP